MNITDALHRAVHSYPGGAESLAPRMRISASSLSHKVSPTYPGAHCSPDEMAVIMELTGDHGPMQALAQRLGYVLLPVPAAVSSDQFAQRLAASVREFGEFVAEVAKDLADNQVSDNELRRIERELAEMMGAAQALYAYAAGRNKGVADEPLPSLRAVG
jgi:hypothetical protein